jgi:hypothetical protein
MWTDFEATPDDWDKIASSFDNYHPTHCYHWGTFQSTGCKILRLAYISEKSHKPTALIQLTQKALPLGITYLRSDGGLAGDYSTLRSLTEFITSKVGNSNWFIRIFNRSLRSPEATMNLYAASFVHPLTRIHTGLSASLALANPYTDRYSGNWRHNLARGKKRNLFVHIAKKFSLAEVAAVYRELETAKNIGEQFSSSELEIIANSFGANLLVSEVRSGDNKLLSIRAALILGLKAFDLLAATTHLGRESYASNLALDELLRRCAEIGVESYDFAGLDPFRGKGVMQFKLGTGALASEYNGEWDFAPKPWIRLIINGLLFFKLRSRQERPRITSLALISKNEKPNPELVKQG